MPSDVSVEIGHIYTPDYHKDVPTRLLEQAAKAREDGAMLLTLVDDVEATESLKLSQDSWRWQMFIDRSAESARENFGSQVYFESWFESKARKIREELVTMELPPGYKLSKTGDKMIVGDKRDKVRISLSGFGGVDDPTYTSCEVLELAWLEHRLGLANKAVSILPAVFVEQQKRVELLARLLPKFAGKSIETVFVNQVGAEQSRHQWSL